MGLVQNWTAHQMLTMHDIGYCILYHAIELPLQFQLLDPHHRSDEDHGKGSTCGFDRELQEGSPRVTAQASACQKKLYGSSV